VIWAYSTSAPTEPSESWSSFTQHRSEGQFSLDMKAAQVQQTTNSGSDAGTSASATGSSSAAATSVSAPQITGVVTPVYAGTGLTSYDKMVIAHGVLMGLSFVIFFPLGAIIIRFLSNILPVPTMMHYITQLSAFLLVLAATVLGIYLSIGEQFMYFHQFFGIIIVILLVFQGMLGWYHHHRFVRDKPSSRRWFTHAHLWLGRVLIVFGLANCGFGLILANVARMYAYIWWAVCGGLVIVYAAVSILRNMSFANRHGKGEAYGNASGPGYSPERWKQAETYTAYELPVRGSPNRI
jgi:hypothetical protein